MKILVTGGAGFIGTNLIKNLIKEGHDVTSIDNYSTGLKENHQDGCYYQVGDIYDFDWRNERYDIIYHLAAIARIQPSFDNPIGYFNTNANSTMQLAEHCVKHNIPIIYAGSSSHHSGKYSNPYTFSKDIGEEILEMYKINFGLKYTIARFYNVYGPYQLIKGGYTTLIGRWIGNIQSKKPCEIYGDGEQRRDFTHVDDIIDGLIKMNSNKAFGHVFELGRNKNYSVNEVAKMFNFTPIYKPSKKGEARNTLCKDTLAKEILGWEPKKDLVNYIKPWFKYK
jgi:UDP-glucose 4-epimerase|tara:strand:- start:626 stop:1468 length:843 start_codon:yes stop_codon:yes gene_type:complete